MARKNRFVLISVMLAAIGCAQRPEPPRTQLTSEQFVKTMVALQVAQPAARPEILRKNGASEADLREFVTAWSAEPKLLGEVFDTIQSRVERAEFTQQ